MKAPELTTDEMQGIRSMSLYWQEVRRRDDPGEILRQEAQGLVALLRPDTILQMAEYCVEARSMQDKENG